MSLFDRIKAIAKALDGAKPEELDAVAAYIITLCADRSRPVPSARPASAVIEENERLRAYQDELKRWVIKGEERGAVALARDHERIQKAVKPILDAAGRIADDTPDHELGTLRVTAGQIRAIQQALSP